MGLARIAVAVRGVVAEDAEGTSTSRQATRLPSAVTTAARSARLIKVSLPRRITRPYRPGARCVPVFRTARDSVDPFVPRGRDGPGQRSEAEQLAPQVRLQLL